MHLAEDLKHVHGELTALDGLRSAESHKVLDEDILTLELGVDLAENVTFSLQEHDGLVLEVEATLDGSLERLEIFGGQASSSSDVKEVLFQQDAAERGDLSGASAELRNQSLSQLGRAGSEAVLDGGFGTLASGVVSAEKFLESSLHGARRGEIR